MLLFCLLSRVKQFTSIDKEEINKLVGYQSFFSNPTSKLCHSDSNGVKYHQLLYEFLSYIKNSSIYDADFAKHLEAYRPKPYDKINQMDYTGIRALLTMISLGDTLSSHQDYICQLIGKGYIPKILQRLKEVSQ
ncbi:hypothetical protein TVAG_157500 [Trichomonas vaginalis G3]|uniref:Uncharacterized protein n=1 Tax=Trichomonas vaginalis (strain ATCC PRA-98 / G3) TaxID=412133 RepID=A2E9M2_TRIV3|nr:hypothetical protein TVAGG3_0746200 [Trichomonas vaginalis G3]EAY10673.1 hypothetical protein TVAG_157500 [Trichomonas vaginalis G3]KAI5512185.1 hypothetical protein TVAGG3_0746200 [Trichomonas vaginalis G3]|eukprot:XP_001322896.1 hypothetical protein [Trichomonas vaginalis G3]